MESPTIHTSLIEWLEDLFPNEVPMDPSANLARTQGQQQVIRKIKQEYRKAH